MKINKGITEENKSNCLGKKEDAVGEFYGSCVYAFLE